MMEGGFLKPSRREKETVSKAHQDADPTRFSLLPQAESSTDTESRGQHRDESYEITDGPERQQFYARLLKGVVPVADIVSEPAADGGTRYYSKHMPHERIEVKTTAAEIDAHILFLSSFLGDTDHSASRAGSTASDHNFRREFQTGTFYDFGMASAFDSMRINGALDSIRRTPDRELLALLRSDVDQMRARLVGVEGHAYVQSLLSGITDVDSFALYDKEVADAYGAHPDKPSLVRDRLLENLDHIDEAIRGAEDWIARPENKRQPLPRPS